MGDALSADHADTPSARGYRQPAEWAPHEATWLSWPHNRDSWPGVFTGVEPAMVEFVRALAACEPVYINVLDADHEGHVRKLLASAVAPERVRLYRFPTNDAWARDHGAISSRARPRSLAAVDFDYNAWGGKYPPFDLDREIGRQMADALGVPRYAKPGIVLEGGSIDVNGEGALLTTEQCLLNPNRNPTLTRADIERTLRDCLGAREILWLGLGIEGDDTDGHIDD
jgi:agmatine deiminase